MHWSMHVCMYIVYVSMSMSQNEFFEITRKRRDIDTLIQLLGNGKSSAGCRQSLTNQAFPSKCTNSQCEGVPFTSVLCFLFQRNSRSLRCRPHCRVQLCVVPAMLLAAFNRTLNLAVKQSSKLRPPGCRPVCRYQSRTHQPRRNAAAAAADADRAQFTKSLKITRSVAISCACVQRSRFSVISSLILFRPATSATVASGTWREHTN